MASRLLSDLHPDLQPKVSAFLAQDKRRFLTQTWRSSYEQDQDYARGRTEPGHIITNAKGGQSPHNFMQGGKPAALAFDFGIKGPHGLLDWDANDDVWQEAIAGAKALGLISGSTFHGLVDSPHAELPNWRSYLSST